MNIVVRSPNWIGDAVMATPAVRALKQAYPESRIMVLAHPRVDDVWQGNPHVHETIPYQGWRASAQALRAGRFDLGVVLPPSFSSAWAMAWGGVKERIGYPGQGRSLLLTRRVTRRSFREHHVTDEYLEIVRTMAPGEYPPEPEIFLSDVERMRGEAWLTEHGVDPQTVVVALCPGATYGPAKRWFPDRFIAAGELLRTRLSPRMLVIGHETERDLVMSIVKGIGESALPLVGESLRTVMAVLSACRVAVTNDTGLMHVAAALRIPTVALFGSTSPTWTRPVGDDHLVVYKPVPCSPCFQRECIRREKDYLCLQLIEPADVVSATVSQIASHPVQR